MNIKPIKDRIIAVRKAPEETTASGIVLPASEKADTNICEVICAGIEVPIDMANKGTYLLIGKYAGTEFKHQGSNYIHFKEDDVIGIVE